MVISKLIRICFVLLSGVILALSPIMVLRTNASHDSLWVNPNEPSFNIDEDPAAIRDYAYHGGRCNPTEMTVSVADSTWPNGWVDKKVNDCVVHTPYGLIGAQYYQPPNSSKASELDMGWGSPSILPNGNKLIYFSSATNWGVNFFAYNEPRSNIRKSTGPANNYEYVYYTEGSHDQALQDNNGNLIKIGATGFSNNSKWMIGQTQSGSFIRVNLDTFDVLPFASTTTTYATQNYELAISDDGRYAAISSWNRNPTFEVFDLLNCSPNSNNQLSVVDGCQSRELWSFLNQKYPNTDLPAQMEFGIDNSQLSMTIQRSGEDAKRITLTAAGHESRQLDYLAMGDSFGSGEGDTAVDESGKKFYVNGTDVSANAAQNIPEEKCHISTRSYPYLLMQRMSISEERSRSIACSGSAINDILNKNDGPTKKGGYRGKFNQYSNEQIYDNVQVRQIKNRAINDFTPGRAAQIEFVEKYKPKVITLSIGGNDTNLMKKIEECVGSLGAFITTCKYANAGEDRDKVALEIASLMNPSRQNLIDTYSQIHAASPGSKIYVIGYPQIVHIGSHLPCSGNTIMTLEERILANQTISYLNKIIEASAKTAGVQYINAEDAFGDKLLCGNDPVHVTGAAFNKPSETQESFHPNHYGHQALANRIGENTNSFTLYCNSSGTHCPKETKQTPETPDYFKTTDTQSLVRPQAFNLLGTEVISKGDGSSENIFINLDGLQPNTGIDLIAYSTPTPLGTFQTNEKGQLQTALTIPNTVPAGYHTFHAYATSMSGEQVDLYQPVLVLGPEGDRDEDEVPDATDPCFLVPSANQDHDQDGTDDACDGYIGEPQLPTNLYRARNGDISRAENPKRLYIERNVEKAVELGITTGAAKDHDPDSDGWALVSRSAGNDPDEDGVGGTNGSFARLWVEDRGVGTPLPERFTPHISARTVRAGCLHITPAVLGRVKPIDKQKDRQPRVVAQDTNLCRSEQPSADVDNNGQADNEQPLYRARNGELSVGENPNRIYVERSRTAAEAQIGKSDYDSDNNGWALVGKSDAAETKGEYRNLQMDGMNPLTIAWHSSGVCIAVKPSSLATVKKGEQRILTRVSLPSGANCD